MSLKLLRLNLSILVLFIPSILMASPRPSSLVKSTSTPKVRVRIAKSLSSALISGMDIKRKIHIGKKENAFEGRKSVKFNCRNFMSKNRFSNKPLLLASLNSPTGLLTFKKQKYRGDLHVVTSPENDSCDIVQELSIDEYLTSLLSKEMNGTWPLEALKAQAVAARTYALYKMKSKQVSRTLGHEAHYDLENSEKHQVSGSFFDATKLTEKAAFETSGMVLLSKKGRRLSPAFFHAKCGGRTLRPDHVWDNKVRGYKSVPCPYCKHSGKKAWKSKISEKRFRKFLNWAKKRKYLPEGFSINKKQKLKIVQDKWSRFNLRIYVEDKPYRLAKSVLRKYFGRVLIPSNNHIISMKGKNFILSGEGLGHGVGMCQIGALSLARKGWSYKKILKHYFPGHIIAKNY